MRRGRRWLEVALLLAGIVALDVWIWSNAANAVWQSWQDWAFGREVQGQRASVSQFLAEKEEQIFGKLESWLGIHQKNPAVVIPPHIGVRPGIGPLPAIGPDGMIGRLSIPRLHLSAMVREGTGEETLSLALGHIPSTALPGQRGNVGVAGHRDRLFRGLKDIRGADVIEFETLYGNYAYQVESTKIVKPKDVGVLKAGDHSELTLVTCYPFYYIGSAPNRFIVKARQVAAVAPGQPWPQALALAAPEHEPIAVAVQRTMKNREHRRAQIVPADMAARAPEGSARKLAAKRNRHALSKT